MPTTPRRSLHLADYEALRNELRLLLNDGYTTAGKWNLAEVCRHLNDWMTFPMDGFPKVIFPLNLVFMIVRKTMGRAMLNKVLEDGSMPAGKPTMPATVYQCDATEDREAVERFLETIDRWDRFSGKPIHSPLFGSMTNEEAKRLQLIHCAHHLSFLLAKT